MSEPQMKSVQCLGAGGLHRMAYWEWGDARNGNVLVCVHGLTRQGRDFDALARRLSDRYRVVCPDVVGRGQSDHLANPAHYQVPAYVADMVTLVARLDVPAVDWIGTSMGGLIGMGLASLPNNPIRRLVLNDVGPAIEFAAIQRIGAYLGKNMDFDTLEQGAAYLRSISAGFGPHSDEAWLALSRPQFKADGQRVRLRYDPRIAAAFESVTPELAAAGEQALWAAYDRIQCPTLLLRGKESDLLTPSTAQAMTQRGPKALLREID
ncbi:MAG: alpha/beta hydrolase, partial [Burkholderiaceae bacterium]|nr:alpha/beta hydrolase [Burkholderiaceae bacterium]